MLDRLFHCQIAMSTSQSGLCMRKTTRRGLHVITSRLLPENYQPICIFPQRFREISLSWEKHIYLYHKMPFQWNKNNSRGLNVFRQNYIIKRNIVGFTWWYKWLLAPSRPMLSLGQGQLRDMNSPVECWGDDSSYILTCDTADVLLFPNKTTNISTPLTYPHIWFKFNIKAA